MANEQTEKLKGKMKAILEARKLFDNAPEDLAPFIDKSAIGECCVDQLLQACKEAGLKFVQYSPNPIPIIKEIDIGS